jgi:photosynthetic reaction center H subunit
MSEILEHYDLALISLYLFWVFFFFLVLYLHRESKREGYPLLTDRLSDRVQVVGFPGLPDPKTFRLPHGHGEVTVPRVEHDTRQPALKQADRFFGAPFDPTGNPMVDGVGPAAYAERATGPDLTMAGAVKIVPLRLANDFHLEERDPDPRGMLVVGVDGVPAGTVTDVWVDRSEYVLRYLEVELEGVTPARRVLVPINFCTFEGQRLVYVRAIKGEHFRDIPAHANPEQVTMREEDQITGYFGGGTLYATPMRKEPLI